MWPATATNARQRWHGSYAEAAAIQNTRTRASVVSMEIAVRLASASSLCLARPRRRGSSRGAAGGGEDKRPRLECIQGGASRYVRACSVDSRCACFLARGLGGSTRLDSDTRRTGPCATKVDAVAAAIQHTRARASVVSMEMAVRFSERFPLPNALVLMRSNWLLLADRGICAGYSDIHSMSIHDVDRPSPPSESMVRLGRWAPRSQWMSAPGPAGGSDDLIQRVSSSGGRYIT
ncbi:hypothetical protein BJ912DRAFT_98674 [Pholiota molesta]|nr:hypothetical protein BJ912DRAFT_98674 [Pholiota molesta]